MTIGENIKSYRNKAGLTQKTLADRLNVSFQTVSKWENDTNEPSLITLKSMCEVFGCSMDDLIGLKNEEKSEEELNYQKEEKNQVEVILQSKVKVGVCNWCKKELFEGDDFDKKSMHSRRHSHTYYVCRQCQDDAKQREEDRKKERQYNDKKGKIHYKPSKVLWWSIFAGIVGLFGGVYTSFNFYSNLGLVWAIIMPIVAGYTVLALIYCMFSDSWIQDLFLGVSSWSIKFPGIIFSFSLDGLKFLILMKLLFWIIGVFVGIFALLAAIALSAFFSIFTFPFVVLKDKNI